MKSVLVATHDREAAREIRDRLQRGYRIDTASDYDSCLEMFRRKRYEFTFIDIVFLQADADNQGRFNYKDVLQPFWRAFPSAPLIILSTQAHLREAVAAVKAGAGTYLICPLDPHEIKYVVDSLVESQKVESELLHFRENLWREFPLEGAWTNSLLMKEVLSKIHSVASTKTTVLLTGETGSGKGVMAKLIHSYSNRKDKPFIAVHCGAIPDSLLESEFFGHEKGAFTGAVRRKPGKFQIADGGTLFLDEIGTITPAAQIKMLQVLQERSFARVGGEEVINVDIRLVAATNMDLKKLAQEGLFREDLYFRLNVFPIEIPPLRERSEDIPSLIGVFLEKLNRVNTKEIKGITPEVQDILLQYSWPGNIRELENLVERAYILSNGPLLSAEDFPGELFALETLTGDTGAQIRPTLEEVRRAALIQVERRYLREILSIHKGRIDQTAAQAGITTRQLRNLMTKYGLRKEEFK